MAASLGLRALFLSADLGGDARWDLADARAFSALMELCEGGLIDIVIGGPPARPGHGLDATAGCRGRRLSARGRVPRGSRGCGRGRLSEWRSPALLR